MSQSTASTAAPGKSWAAALLVGSAIGLSAPALAQNAPVATETSAETAPPAVYSGTVRAVVIRGAERLEPATVRSYVGLSPGDSYDRNRLDRALKDLYATELFADVTIRDRQGELIVDVKENPVVNRVVLEGNKRIKSDKLTEEIRLSPRQIFTRSKAKAEVARIIELYRRKGRFAAVVEPKIVQLDQNRVDVVFEIEEGPKSKVRKINFVGNKRYSDGKLRGEMATREGKWYRFFTSNDTYDPDRSAYDQQQLRQYYLTEGYADFRVVSSVAELTPDRKDFILTYVVDEGERYKFGEVQVESKIRDIKEDAFLKLVPIRTGDWYNAKTIEDTVTSMTETAGLLGYAFADVSPRFERDKEGRTMSVTFVINETPRVYVERVDINGNVITKDKVVRREFRLAEGDAFNSFRVKRSRDRIQSLGYFQEKLEVEQKPGSGPDKVILEVNAEEQPTGELQISAGFSSLERFIINLSVRQRNFRGMGQELRASVNWSQYSKSAEIGFTEPYLFGRNIALGGDIFRRDYNSFRFLTGGDRETTYEQSTTGFQIRTGFPITEFVSASFRYGLNFDDISLDQATYFTNGACDPIKAGRYLCDTLGNRTTSSIGYSLAYDTRNNRYRPSSGHQLALSQDIAGVGGSVNYVRTRLTADKYWRMGRSNFILNIGGEAGHIFGWGGDRVRLNDRFFLGEPRFRGFDIRGVGPRVIRRQYTDPNGTNDPSQFVLVDANNNQLRDDSLGGSIYYSARVEMEIPLGQGASELGLRPSAFVDVGALWKTDFDPRPASEGGDLFDIRSLGVDGSGNHSTGYKEFYLGDTMKPRVSVGIGVNWRSPFGPFRFDIAKALVKQEGDDTKLFQFNVGTQF